MGGFMNRFVPTLAMFFVLLSSGVVQAQITLNYVDRTTGCELDPMVARLGSST
jgi:hypothetical protein